MQYECVFKKIFLFNLTNLLKIWKTSFDYMHLYVNYKEGHIQYYYRHSGLVDYPLYQQRGIKNSWLVAAFVWTKELKTSTTSQNWTF